MGVGCLKFSRLGFGGMQYGSVQILKLGTLGIFVFISNPDQTYCKIFMSAFINEQFMKRMLGYIEYRALIFKLPFCVTSAAAEPLPPQSWRLMRSQATCSHTCLSDCSAIIPDLFVEPLATYYGTPGSQQFEGHCPRVYVDAYFTFVTVYNRNSKSLKLFSC